MNKPAIKVHKRGNKWVVRVEGRKRVYRRLASQREAIECGRQLCTNMRTELIVYREDNTIRSKDTLPQIGEGRFGMFAADPKEEGK